MGSMVTLQKICKFITIVNVYLLYFKLSHIEMLRESLLSVLMTLLELETARFVCGYSNVVSVKISAEENIVK
jgi:hypothetical protein